MRDTDKFEELLEQWAIRRREDSGAGDAFTSEVMKRLVAREKSSPVELPASRCKGIALTTACTAAGIGKVLFILHLAV